jgi:hypothetical protein
MAGPLEETTTDLSPGAGQAAGIMTFRLGAFVALNLAALRATSSKQESEILGICADNSMTMRKHV